MTTFLTVVFIIVAILIVLIVLVQRGRGGGLAGAFGSGGGSSSAFGTKTGDVFTTVTVVFFVIFMLLAIWLNFRFRDYKSTIAGGIASQPAALDLSTPVLPGATSLPGYTPTAPALPVVLPSATTSAPASQPK